MVRDFGAGLTVDELIGLSALQIIHLTLPPGDVFRLADRAAQLLVRQNKESLILEEIWADGHTVWLDPSTSRPFVVSPNGQILPKK